MTPAEVERQPQTAPLAEPAVGRALGKPSAFGSSWRSLTLTLLAVLALGYGWKVTRIDLVQLVAGLPNMQHIARGLLPWMR